MIVLNVTVSTIVCILSQSYSIWQADGEKIIDEKEWMRIFTSPFAVASFLDLFFMCVSFIWLYFTLTHYVPQLLLRKETTQPCIQCITFGRPTFALFWEFVDYIT